MSEAENAPAAVDNDIASSSGISSEAAAAALKRSHSACLQLEDLEPRGVALRSASTSEQRRPVTPPRELSTSVETSGGASGIMPEPNFTREASAGYQCYRLALPDCSSIAFEK